MLDYKEILKNCSCGSTDVAIESILGAYRVYCRDCKKTTYWKCSLDDAVTSWNKINTKGKTVILIGESGSGKSALANCLTDTYKFQKVVTCTTRPKRVGETDDVDYHFIDEEAFYELLGNNEFIEYARYNNWLYGTLKSSIEEETDKVIIMTPHGYRQLKEKLDCLDNIYSVYIEVPRRDRLIKILQRGDDIEEAYRRNLSDVGQFDGIEDEVNFIIGNSKYTRTPEQLAAIIIARIHHREGVNSE